MRRIDPNQKTLIEVISEVPEGWTLCFEKLSDETAEPEKGYDAGDYYVNILRSQSADEIGFDCKPDEIGIAIATCINWAETINEKYIEEAKMKHDAEMALYAEEMRAEAEYERRQLDIRYAGDICW